MMEDHVAKDMGAATCHHFEKRRNDTNLKRMQERHELKMPIQGIQLVI
jgi:hypothetical protein